MYEDELQNTPPFKIFEYPNEGSRFDVYLNCDIVSPDQYIDLVHLIRTGKSSDEIYIHLNNGGGNAFTAMELANVISETQATVIGVANGMVASAAGIIFMACHAHVVNEYIQFMAHNYSGGYFGKGSDIKSQLRSDDEFMDSFYRSIYKDFFTEDEITGMMEGKDIWLSAEEVSTRLANRHDNYKDEIIGSMSYKDQLSLFLQDDVQAIDEETYFKIISLLNN